MAYISLQHVVKRYQMGEVVIPAVDDVSFEIEKGEFAVILGPSGAGKTTVRRGLDSGGRPGDQLLQRPAADLLPPV